jgi:7-cyano-7-deazaguanine synthase in queuosine biosynthesis
MKLPSFAYRVDSRGNIFRLDGAPHQTAIPTKSAQVFVDGVQHPHGWLTNFAEPERDLLRVMAAVLDLDRLSRRRPHDVKAEKRELHWRRVFDVEIAVENPGRWQAVGNDLRALLAFLTDDSGSLAFVQADQFHEQRVLFAPGIDPSAEVALFSGGLDSSVGLRARHLQRGGTFVAVSAVGNEVRRRAQHDALRSLRGLGVPITQMEIDHQLQGDLKPEVTQRTRGLFFLAIGAAVGSHIGNPRFHVYETGVGCLNVPTSAAQVASQGTRAMHPNTLGIFNALVEKVLDQPSKAVVPYFFLTKGELCSQVAADLDVLAPLCSSCDEGDGHKRDPMLHCGLCTSCMFRRIDPTRYRDLPSKLRHNSYELAAFEHHANVLSRVAAFEDLTDADPNVRHVFKAPIGADLALDVARSQTVEMYHRYAAEIRRFLTVSRPTPRPRTPHAAKEVVRDLFAATR